MSNKTQLSNNNTKLASFIQELQGKAAGGGASVETCTVNLTASTSSYRPYCYSYTTVDNNGNITGAAVAENSATTVTLNNVVCGSVVTVNWQNAATETVANAQCLVKYGKQFIAFLITAPAGGTATINNVLSGGGIA